MKLSKHKLLLILLCLTGYLSNAQSGREIIDISGNNWKICLDTEAKWENDLLYLPGTNIKDIPVNIPTGGWETLQKAEGNITQLPATIEQFYWGKNGNSFGVAGNYLGVSWFTTTVKVPESMKGKRIVLDFESVRFRAEIFVNKKLTGYDLVNSTPFQVDISENVIFGKDNEISVRITDPNGNFDWRDSKNFMWGDYRTQPSHGFGGITGKVKIIATDITYLDDVFIRNKPTANEIDIEVYLKNNKNNSISGSLFLQLKESGSGKVVFKKEYSNETLNPEENKRIYTVKLSNAKLWSVESPFLYTAEILWIGKDNSADKISKRFGFRWFEVKDIKGDKQFFLNGKRIVLRTAISWGFWPVNGIAPSDDLARIQIEDAKKLGLNMLNFHRTIGQTNVLDLADEMGLLYFEEPGGNQYPEGLFEPKNDLEKKQTEFYLAVRNEKFFRMIKRDRSHPSLIIYNMHNERGAQPHQRDREEMLAGHRLDPSRIFTYNSCNGQIKLNEPDPKFKLHLFPYDTTFYDYGWFDQHHAGGPGVYHDNLYNNPKEYAKYTDHKDEIMYYGEEGAIGTPPRLQLIRDEILKTGKDIGWETDDYLNWYDAYNDFLIKNGFTNAFQNVDSLTRKMGNVAYYYQGRVIENTRINNITDGYAVNGWESMKLENHSGIVDNYRNLKGDAELISRYNKPLYVAVKLNHKVLETGDTGRIDLFIVNEDKIKGKYQIEVRAITPEGKTLWEKKSTVNVSGGNIYGELLIEGLKYKVTGPGYTRITAQLKEKGKTVAEGEDEIFAVSLNTENIPLKGQIADTTGIIANYLHSAGISSFSEYKTGWPQGKYLLVGSFNPQETGNPLVTDILEWVNTGNTLIIVGSTDNWAEFLARKEVADYRGSKVLGKSWYGGNFFVKEHPLFNGLPQNCVFNWEYQCLAAYNKNRLGMRLFNGETIVGCVSDHKAEVYSALNILPHGRGKIILCSLDLLSCIKDVKAGKLAEGDGENASMATFNQSVKNSANIVGQQLLLNLIKYSSNNQ